MRGLWVTICDSIETQIACTNNTNIIPKLLFIIRLIMVDETQLAATRWPSGVLQEGTVIECPFASTEN
jgi:hypothetical protein